MSEDTAKETPVILSQGEAVNLIDKLIHWSMLIQEGNTVEDWQGLLEESLKLEKKLERARGADFVGWAQKKVREGHFKLPVK